VQLSVSTNDLWTSTLKGIIHKVQHGENDLNMNVFNFRDNLQNSMSKGPARRLLSSLKQWFFSFQVRYYLILMVYFLNMHARMWKNIDAVLFNACRKKQQMRFQRNSSHHSKPLESLIARFRISCLMWGGEKRWMRICYFFLPPVAEAES